MEDKDWIFEKWPNWVRWICFLPLGIIGSITLALISNFSIAFTGYSPDSPIARTSVQLASLAGLFYVIYLCIPKYKEIVTGIISILMSIIALVEVVLFIAYDSWLNWDCFIIFLVFIGCLIFGVMLFVEYGKKLNIKNTNINNYYIEE